jgi:hypothetical protein
MEKLGYGDQPYIVYLHEDTGRRHIHIVSTCVREDGTKISDAYIHKRSMAACRELEQKYGLKQIAGRGEEAAQTQLRKVDHKKGDLKRQVRNVLKEVFTSYRFRSFGEYSAMLSCFNIEAKQVRGEHNGKPYNGVVYLVIDERGRAVSQPLKSSLLGKQFGHGGIEKRIRRNVSEFKAGRWRPKINDTIAAAMANCGGKQKRFVNLLKAQNIDAVFRTNERGRIYGATFVDHNAREVYNGSRLGKEFSANAFENLFNGPDRHLETLHHNHGQTSFEAAFGIFDISPDLLVRDYDEDESALQIKPRKRNQLKR